MSKTILHPTGYLIEVGNTAAGLWWWFIRDPNKRPIVVGDDQPNKRAAIRAASRFAEGLAAKDRAA